MRLHAKSKIYVKNLLAQCRLIIIIAYSFSGKAFLVLITAYRSTNELKSFKRLCAVYDFFRFPTEFSFRQPIQFLLKIILYPKDENINKFSCSDAGCKQIDIPVFFACFTRHT